MGVFHEFDDVVLQVNLPDIPLDTGGYGLFVGDEGALVDLAPDGTGGMVEFFRNGESVAVIGVPFAVLAPVFAPVVTPVPVHGTD